MPELLTQLWKDEVGSAMSAEMALVTSVTVGALFSGMGQFSATVNREFQNSAGVAGLTVADIEKKEELKEQNQRKKPDGLRFLRAEDRVKDDTD